MALDGKLTIRREQMEAFRDAAMKRLEQRIVDHLKIGFSKHAANRSDDDLRELVRTAREQSAGYSIRIEWDVCRYAEQALVYGDAFDRTPWAASILSSRILSGTQKMDRIEYHHRHILSEGIRA